MLHKRKQSRFAVKIALKLSEDLLENSISRYSFNINQ